MKNRPTSEEQNGKEERQPLGRCTVPWALVVANCVLPLGVFPVRPCGLCTNQETIREKYGCTRLNLICLLYLQDFARNLSTN